MVKALFHTSSIQFDAFDAWTAFPTDATNETLTAIREHVEHICAYVQAAAVRLGFQQVSVEQIDLVWSGQSIKAPCVLQGSVAASDAAPHERLVTQIHTHLLRTANAWQR